MSTDNKHAERLDQRSVDVAKAEAGPAFEEVWNSHYALRPAKETASEPSVIEFTALAEFETPDSKGLPFKGNITTKDEFGNQTTKLADGGRINEDAYGRSYLTTHGETYTVVGKPTMQDDGTVTVELADHSLDVKQVYRTNGVVEHWKKNGDQVIDYPNSTKRLVVSLDGTLTLEDTQDGSFQRTRPNGEAVIVDSKGDKTILVEAEDPKRVGHNSADEEGALGKLADWISSL